MGSRLIDRICVGFILKNGVEGMVNKLVDNSCGGYGQ